MVRTRMCNRTIARQRLMIADTAIPARSKTRGSAEDSTSGSTNDTHAPRRQRAAPQADDTCCDRAPLAGSCRTPAEPGTDRTNAAWYQGPRTLRGDAFDRPRRLWSRFGVPAESCGTVSFTDTAACYL